MTDESKLALDIPLFIQSAKLEALGLATSGIIPPDEVRLARLVLRKCVTTIPFQTLHQSYLVHSFAEPLHPRSVVWDVVTLNFLNHVVIFRHVGALVANVANISQNR